MLEVALLHGVHGIDHAADRSDHHAAQRDGGVDEQDDETRDKNGAIDQ